MVNAGHTQHQHVDQQMQREFAAMAPEQQEAIRQQIEGIQGPERKRMQKLLGGVNR